MDKHSHIIGRHLFEIDFSSREKTYELQNRVSSIFRNQLTDGMEKVFDRMILQNKLVRVDNLVLDIGNIPLDLLEDEFARRVLEKLEQELLLLLLHDNSGFNDAEDLSNDQTGAYLSLLEYFLLKGMLPWWGGGGNLATPGKALEFLLTNSSRQLKELITRTGQKSYVRTRLVYQFSEQHIRSVIGILEPGEAPFIIGYHTEVVKVQQEKQVVRSEESDFRKAVWVFILTYLLVDRGSHF